MRSLLDQLKRRAARDRGAGGADLARGERPRRGSQVQVASLAPEQRSREQPMQGPRTGAWWIPPADLSVAGREWCSACWGGGGLRLLGVP